MIGIVLCGGQSLRMGQDKGLIISGTRSSAWAEIMKEKFSELSLPSVLSINARQKDNYLRLFDENDLLIDNPQLTIQGPVRGLLSAHLKYPQHDLMVLACDMITMNAAVLRKLLDDYETFTPAAIAYKTDYIEPMCSIYSASGLTRILTLLNQNQLEKTSMTYVLNTLNTTLIPVPENWKTNFRNLNSLEDVNE